MIDLLPALCLQFMHISLNVFQRVGPGNDLTQAINQISNNTPSTRSHSWSPISSVKYNFIKRTVFVIIGDFSIKNVSSSIYNGTFKIIIRFCNFSAQSVFNSENFFVVSEARDAQVTLAKKSQIKMNSFKNKNIDFYFFNCLIDYSDRSIIFFVSSSIFQ